MLKWIEAIPFVETQGYVQRVIENSVVYDSMRPASSQQSAMHVSRYLGKSRRADNRPAMADSPPRFITPEGFARLRAEYDELFGVERPKVVEVVSWAASLGDRSENADYLYGKKRLREIDRRLSHLARIMKAAKVVDPASQSTAPGPVRRDGRACRRGRPTAARSPWSAMMRRMPRPAGSAGARRSPAR